MHGELSKQSQTGKDSDKNTGRGDNYGKWKDQGDYNRDWWRYYQAWQILARIRETDNAATKRIKRS